MDDSIFPHESLKLFAYEISCVVQNKYFRQSMLCEDLPQFIHCCSRCCRTRDVSLDPFGSQLLPTTSYRETVQHSQYGCESTVFLATPKDAVEQRVVTCYAADMCHVS